MKLRPISYGLLTILAALAALQACGGGAAVPPVEAAHTTVVNLMSDQENRRPMLRATCTLIFPGDAVADAVVLARVSGAEGLAAVHNGLSELPTVEEIKEDQNFAKEEASSSIIEQFQAAGMPPPTKVIFTEWVIQG